MNYLFDMDGVVVDSKEAWFRLFNDIADIDRETFERRYWGRDLEANVKELGFTRAEFCRSVLPKHLDGMETVPGARDVLSALRGKKALVTNTTRRCTARILAEQGLEPFFDAVVTSDEVEMGKPDPAIIRLAIERIGADPASTVVIGDSEHDIEAGRAAGCITIGIGVDADYTVDDLKDVLRVAERLEGNGR